ncbi:MAG: hypothetical protein AAFZ15_34565 [Bacteroidota bacterium]
MANLTQQDKVVIDRRSNLDPVLGYNLLIFRNRVYFKFVRNRERYKPSFWERGNNYHAYAVSSDNNLLLRFRKTPLTTSGVYRFHIDFEVSYSIPKEENAMMIVEKLSSDPLKRLRAKIGSLICGELSELDWNIIFDNNLFKKHKHKALEKETDGSPNIELIREFALDLGIQVNNIEFNRVIPERDGGLTVKKAFVKASTDEQLAEIEHENKKSTIKRRTTEKVLENQGKLLDALTDSTKTALEQAFINMGGVIDTPEKFREAIQTAKEIQKDFYQEIPGESTAFPTGNSMDQNSRRLNPEKNYTSESVEIVESVKHWINSKAIATGEKGKLLSAVLHLAASIIHSEESIEPKTYVEELFKLELNSRDEIFIKEFFGKITELKTQLL